MGNHDALIVDDNERYLAACGRLARRRGFNPILLSSFEKAQTLVANTHEPPEAILIDVVLNSGKSGVALREEIIEAHQGRASVALMSAYPPVAGVKAIAKSATKQIDQFLVDAAILRVTGFHPVLSAPLTRFAHLHGLSPQEARLAAQLFVGTTRTGLAEALSLSENTVKSQVRQLLRRTNAGSIDDLVAQLLHFSFEATRGDRVS